MSGLRYLSICSGIEVAALAWVPLGWRPVLVSEVEAFPREVLRVRHGAFDARFARSADSLALWGDFTALRMRHLRRLGIDPADIDVLVGGTPCQGFSVAGLRGSLSDPRGGLSLAFLRLAHAIQSVRARAGRPDLIVVWENVPGVFSTPDNAFGCFLGALIGADDAVLPSERPRRGRSTKFWRWRPAKRWPILDGDGNETGKFGERAEAHIPCWPCAGMVSGPRGRAAWRVFDAQHFGLAQRRERVFLAASLGDGADPAAILFEPKGLRGDPAQGGEAREDVAAALTASAGGISGKDGIAGRIVASTLAGGARGSGGYSTDDIPLVAACLNGLGEYGSDLPTLRAKGGDVGGGSEALLAPTLTAQYGEAAGRDLEAAGALIIAPPLANALRAEGFDASEDGTGFAIGDLPGALRGDGNGGGHAAVALTSGVRRLMPVECERLQGVPDHFTRIPWRGRPAEECPDGPRYRALGNAYPRPVLAWIGRRIAATAGAPSRLQAAE